MKAITIDNKTIEISDESYEAFKKQFVDSKVWKPKPGENYWYIDSEGCVDYSWWKPASLDGYRYSIGNCFEIAGEAEEALETGWVAYLQALKRLKDYITENGLEFEPDWSDGEDKHGLFYDHGRRRFSCDNFSALQSSTLPYFKTVGDVEQVIRDCEPELKILFGVK